MDSLAMFFGAKKRRPARKETKHVVVVGGRERKLYKGKNGGMYYKTKSGKTYVTASALKRKGSKTSPKRAPAKKPVKKAKKPSRYGYGLGMPPLSDMMGPSGLSVVPPAPVSANKFGYMNYY